MEKSQIEKIKGKLKEHLKVLEKRTLHNCAFADLRDNEPIDFHDGVAAEGIGIKVLFEVLFKEELQN